MFNEASAPAVIREPDMLRISISSVGQDEFRKMLVSGEESTKAIETATGSTRMSMVSELGLPRSSNISSSMVMRVGSVTSGATKLVIALEESDTATAGPAS